MKTQKKILELLMILCVLGSGSTLGESIRPNTISTGQGLSNNNVTCIHQDRLGFIWIGTEDGLNMYDGKNFVVFKHEPDNPHSLTSSFITALNMDGSGVLWIGTDKGLNRLNRKQGRFTRLVHDRKNPESLSSNHISTIFKDCDHNLWIGTMSHGINFLPSLSGSISSKKFTRFQYDPDTPASLNANNIRVIYQDRQGILWIGTHGKGFFFLSLHDRGRNTPEIKLENSVNESSMALSDSRITALFEDSVGRFWVGTSGEGLIRWNPEEKTVTVYTKVNGLTDDRICGILEDNTGKLWISTKTGMSVFDPEAGQFENAAQQSLSSSEYNQGASFRSKNGDMFFGSSNGVKGFSPDKSEGNPHPPRIVMRNLIASTEANDSSKNVELGDYFTEPRTLKFVHKKAVMAFEIIALDYTDPERNRYAFKLEGFNKNWLLLEEDGTFLITDTSLTNYKIKADRKDIHATLINDFPLGEYVLRVKGSNNSGVWNEEGLSIGIIIVKPYWKRWWFFALLGVLILLIFTSGYLIKVRRVRAGIQMIGVPDDFVSQYGISNREKEILDLLLRGRSNEDIGEELFISVNTVKTHVYNVFQKLGVKNRLQVINLILQAQKKPEGRTT